MEDKDPSSTAFLQNEQHIFEYFPPVERNDNLSPMPEHIARLSLSPEHDHNISSSTSNHNERLSSPLEHIACLSSTPEYNERLSLSSKHNDQISSTPEPDEHLSPSSEHIRRLSPTGEHNKHLLPEYNDRLAEPTELEHDSLPNSDNEDGHDASVEFSNACRRYYYNRVKATETFMQDVENDDVKSQSRQKTTSIDSAMEKLRKEMASLMEQDLTLLRQLLTLNDTIEDIKSQRIYGSSKESLSSSRDLYCGSDWSVSETDMYCPDEELESSNSKLKTRNDRTLISFINKNKNELHVDECL